MTRHPFATLVLLVGLAACGDDGANPDGGTDSGGARDSGVAADGRVDVGAIPDGGTLDATPGVDGPIRQIATGRHHTCALMREGTVFCWGQGAYRALGGDYDFQGVPRRVEAFDDARAIAAGTRFGCALRPGGAAHCWGENADGQLLDNATIPCGDCTPIPACADSVCVATPQPMPGLEGDVVDLALGRAHGCALRSDGQVLCWGDNESGQVAQADLASDFVTPQLVAGITDARQISAGLAHTCALVGSPGRVTCWGANDRAQVGNGGTDDAVPVPATVEGLDDAVEIIAGGSHSCARRATGAVVCWGYNYLGSLGNGSTRPTRASSIQEVVGIDDAVELAAGQYFTCARRTSGALWCWGDNRHGQLGDGTSEGADCAGRPCRVTPTESLMADAVHVSAGELHACAVDGEGRLFCWGYNLGGQLGTGGVDDGPTPTPVEVMGLP